MIAEFLEVSYSRHGTCKLLYDTSLALARSSPTRRYTGLILVFFGRIKIGLVFGFCSCHFIGIGLVLVYHFSENDISSRCITRMYILHVLHDR